MRRLQHVLGMLIAMFALCSVLMLTGCNGESDTEDAMEDAAEDVEDAAEDAGDAVEDTVDDMGD